MSSRPWRLPELGIGTQIVALVLVLGLVGAMAIQPTRQLLAQEQRIRATAREFHKTQQANDRLKKQIAALRNPDYIEEQARAQIGLVRPGETAYIVMPKPHQHHKNHGGRWQHRHPAGRRSDKHESAIRGFLDFLGL